VSRQYKTQGKQAWVSRNLMRVLMRMSGTRYDVPSRYKLISISNISKLGNADFKVG